MTTPIRDPEAVINSLREACARHPEMRVMQVIVNACGAEGIFYLEDKAAAARLFSYDPYNRI